MDPELKQKWLKALRSGKYQQGQLYLKDGNQFCCLGVLCDIIDPTRWNTNVRPDFGALRGNALGGAIANHLELSEFHTKQLVEMNDNTGSSFTEIAAYIEKHF